MNLIEEIAGELCKIILPIEETVYFGNPNSHTAICTLSSMVLLKEIKHSSLMDKISIVGRLLSENKGIDSLVRYVISNNITTIILCGKDTIGHRPGHSLLCLYNNGIDKNHKIIGSQSPDPTVTLSQDEISRFQDQVNIINQIDSTEISNLMHIIEKQNQ
ncbi:MAG: tetrahydromethanopterin S-methyltransferase subunit A [Nitrososphaera sp.]|jgi:tetrahydromethanopterin S-methyltransferase subunit A